MSQNVRPKRSSQGSSGARTWKRQKLSTPLTTRATLRREIKQVSQEPLAPQGISTNGSVTAYFGGISEGNNPDERNGRVVKILGHRFRILLNKTDITLFAVVRVLVYRWNQALDSTFAANQVVNLGLAGITAGYVENYRGQYKILYDQTYVIRDVGNQRFTSAGAGVANGFNNIQEFIEFYIRDPHLETYYAANAGDRSDKTNLITIYAQTSNTAAISECHSTTMFEDI